MKISTKLLAILLCVCFSLLIFANNIFANENSLVTVNADTIEQQDSQKIKNDEIKEINDENLYSLPQSSDKISIFSSKSEILSSITSNDEFSIKGNILINGQTADVNDFYDFSNYSKYNIADWLYSINVITEKEKIDCYCDLILNKNYENTKCLEGVFDDINKFSLNRINDNELLLKIERILSEQINQNTALNGVYSNDYFLIHYDSSIDTYNEALAVGEYCNQIRSSYISMGFLTPILQNGENKYHIYLEPNAASSVELGSTYKIDYYNNTCSSYIKIYNFSFLNDAIKEVIGHEYFHAIQNAYNHQSGWFKECCANWGSIVSTGISLNSDTWLEYYFEQISTPIDQISGYATFMLPLTIYHSYGGASTIEKIYQNYNDYGTSLNLQGIKNIITYGMLDNGYSGGFEMAFRTMSGYLYNPSYFFDNMTNTSNTWENDAIINKPITSVNGSITFSVSLNYLTSKYYRIEIPESSVCTATVNVSFSNSKGRVQEYRKYTNDCEVLCHTSSSGGVSYASPNLGDNGREAGIILSNVGNSGTVTCNVTVQLTYQIENINFACQHADRYLERRVHLKDDQYAEYNITFGTAGNKIIQTFGTADTTIKVYNSNGVLLANSDDDGYEYNAFVSINTSANQTLKIRVALCNEDDEDWTKLSIVPSNLFLEHGSTTFDNYEDILNINTYHNFTLYSYAIINSMQSLTYSPPVDGRYSVTLESEFDNFLYVIDPSSSNLLVEGEDYHDDLDSDYGDYNAHICKNFYSDIRYFVLFGQSNISTPFDNLGTGNDIAVLFRFQNAI